MEEYLQKRHVTHSHEIKEIIFLDEREKRACSVHHNL